TKGDGMQDLGTLGGCFSRADAINDVGQVIGESTTDCNAASAHPFLWTKADGMKDLGTSPGLLGGLTGVNIFGNVVGAFCSEPCSGTQHAFIWTKRTDWLDLNNLIQANSGWELILP